MADAPGQTQRKNRPYCAGYYGYRRHTLYVLENKGTITGTDAVSQFLHNFKERFRRNKELFPNYTYRISLELLVCGYNGHVFSQCLGNQKPVKWIAMMAFKR
jgi:hypothetical protein